MEGFAGHQASCASSEWGEDVRPGGGGNEDPDMRLMECQWFARSYWQRYAGPNGEWNREVGRVRMDLNQLAAWQESWDRTKESLKARIFCIGDIQGNDRQVWEDQFNAVAPTAPGDGGDG